MNRSDIGKVCHEVNRALCEAYGDLSQKPWEEAPEWQKTSTATVVNMHLANESAGPQASHEAWMADKLSDGWMYGSVKDPEKKTHPLLIPFDQLPKSDQAKDFAFHAVVLALKPLLTE